MKALTISNQSVTKKALLKMAQRDSTTWLGIRITAGLLVLDGWNSTQIAEFFDVSRWTAVQWIQRLNKEGVTGLIEKKRSGRPVRINKNVRNQPERAFKMDHPEVAELSHNR